ncbi:MAG: cell division protein ZapA [Bacteroidales bacterium]|nr:cell division protein ZapA [Bacteroidales bacterium]
MKDKQNITLCIADKKIALQIDPEEEETLRLAAKDINHAWEEMRRSRPQPLEALALVTLMYAKAYYKQRQTAADTEKALADFESNLDALLRSGALL